MPVDAPAPVVATSLPPRGSRLPGLVQTLVYGKFRHRVLPRAQRRHGDLFTLKLAQFGKTVVVVADPEQMLRVFTGPDTAFHGGEGNAVLAPAMGTRSMLVLDEDEHKRMRRLVLPAFSGAALRGYREMVVGIAAGEVAVWPVGKPFSGHRRMQELTLDVIVRVVFGITDQARLAEMRPLVRAIAAIGPITLLGLSDRRLRGFGPWRTFRAVQQRLDELLYAEIAERRRSADLSGRTDVLSRLLHAGADDAAGGGLSDAELHDQLITLLLAGHETTAAALAWALHELARRPEYCARVRQAALADDDDYLTAVAKETLRIRPVVFEVARTLAEPVELGEYRLPAGVSVMPAIGLSLAAPRYYPDTTEFRPERFLTDDLPATAWLPFGSGGRRCIGAGFALMEIVGVLKAVLRDHDLAPDRPARERARVRSVTLVPRRGARIVLTPRR
ncbi:cytochrome P450 [Amycolatopsis pigmentata]|uniref:Cytochrome P450 n=1 Tax=Amycolatopsis pigmentata TaxID=450801 RepID=A0ABW5FLJ9_9PSEU